MTKLTPRQKELLWCYQRHYFGCNETFQKMVESINSSDDSKDGKLFRIALSAIDLPPFPMSGKPSIVEKNLMLKGFIVLFCREDIEGKDYWLWDLTEKGRAWKR